MTNKKEGATIHCETLNWDVQKAQAQYPFQGGQRNLDKTVLINDTTGDLISVMSPKYPAMSNKEFTELAELAAESFGIKISHYTSRKGGKQVLVAFERPETEFKIGQWGVKNHLVFVNSHDGTKAFEVAAVNKLYRCNNMFASAAKNIGLKIYHNSNFDVAIEELKLELLQVDTLLAQEFEELNRWQHVEIDPKIITEAKAMLFPQQGKITTTETNKRLAFDESMHLEIEKLGHNLFGLFNGVTHYTTHNFMKKEIDTRDYPLEGKRAEYNDNIFEFCRSKALELA